jgi:hypothetical protein
MIVPHSAAPWGACVMDTRSNTRTVGMHGGTSVVFLICGHDGVSSVLVAMRFSLGIFPSISNPAHYTELLSKAGGPRAYRSR